MTKEWLTNDLWRAHVSWLTPEWIGQTEDGRKSFDAVKWIDDLRRAKYNSLIFYNKHHDGFCTFPSAYSGTKKPERDFFGETVVEAKKHGMKVMAYYSSVLDYELALKHEDWRVVRRDGKSIRSWLDFFVPGSYLCINNPEYRQLMLNQIQEILNYDPDGVWIDVYCPMAYVERKKSNENCFCKHCQEKYFSETGGDIFDTESDVWYRKCYDEFLQVMNDFIKACNPDCVITVNQARMPGCNEIMDFYTSESGSADGASILSRSLRDGKKPFEMTYRMYSTVGSWAMRNAEVIKLESAMIIAHGGACSIEISPTHTAFFQKDAIDTLEKVGSYIRSIEKYCINTEPLYDAAYLMPDNLRGVLWYWDSPLTERDIPYDFVYRNTDLSKYQLVILDPHITLDMDIINELEDYVKNGGNLIVECNVGVHGSEAYGIIINTLGLKSAVKVAGNIRYISNIDKSLSEGMGSDPLIVENIRETYTDINAVPELDAPYFSIVPESAIPVAYYNYACGDKGLGKNIFNRLPPAINCSSEPAITINKYGKGKAMFIACPLVYSELNVHKQQYSTIDRRVFTLQFAANLARHMLNEPLLKDSTPAGVEIVANKQNDRHIFHIFNHYCEGKYIESRNEMLRLSDITLFINSSRIGAVSRIYSAGDGNEPKEMPFERDGKWLKIVIPVLGTNEILILQ